MSLEPRAARWPNCEPWPVAEPGQASVRVSGRCRLCRWVAVSCCCLVVNATGACGGGHPTLGVGVRAPGTLRVLQMNLCDSGIAPCYTGRAVAEAARVVQATRPDIVTLNEVCSHDVSMLARSLRSEEPGSFLISEFKAVPEPRSGPRDVRCRNGEAFGVGLLVRTAPPYRGYTVSGGTYPSQDAVDTEKRVWLCVHAIGHFYACTTHLASTSVRVALSQCRYLMDIAIPALRIGDRRDPVIIGADLNLRDAQQPNAQSCLPHGFVRTDDGKRQDVVASAPQTVSGRTINMYGTTDHPALLVDVLSTSKK
jgi:endonuclease/exonuclease/phosphatase family metal-dependent hydrolase